MRRPLLIGLVLALIAVVIVIFQQTSETDTDTSADPTVEHPRAAPDSQENAQDVQAVPGETLEMALFKAHFKPHEVPKGLSEGVLATKAWGSATLNYQEGDYSQALPGFMSTTETEDVPIELVQFYIGQTCLALEDGKAAAVAFDKVLTENGTLIVEAQWYMALTQLLLENTQEATERLQRLVTDKTYKAERASLLLEQLSTVE